MLVRSAESDDAIAVARVHVHSWQVAYRTLLPGNYLDQLRPEDRAQKYNFSSLDPLQPRTVVAVDAGVIHGFATTAPARELDMPGHGELCALYVDPIIGAAGLVWRLSVRLGLAFSISDFGMPFYGYLRATFVQSAFTELIGVCLMASAAQNRSEA
jgi:hypothetical protein